MSEFDQLHEMLRQWRAGALSDEDFQRLNELLRQHPDARRATLHDSALKQALGAEHIYKIQTRPKRWPQFAAAATLILCLLAAWLLGMREPGPGTEITFSRQNEQVSLGDGRSQIQGTADSRIRILQNNEQIAVALLDGSISCTVSANSPPLRVQTPSGTAQATNASFLIRLNNREETMTSHPFLVKVLAGSVLVSGGWGEATVHAEEQQTFPPQEEVIEAPDAVAQLQKQLQEKTTVHFEKMKLTDVVLFLQKQMNVDLVLDPTVFANSDDLPNVSIKSSDVSLKNLLDMICWQLNIEHSIQDEAVYISSAQEPKPYMRMYALHNLPQGMDDGQTAQLIHKILPLDSVDDIGVDLWNGKLMATVDKEHHQRIESGLALIRTVELNQDILKPEMIFDGGKWLTPYEGKFNETITLIFEETQLTDAVAFIQAQTGINICVHPAVTGKTPPITLRTTEMKIKTAFKWITEVCDLEMQDRGGILYLGHKEHMRDTIHAYALPGPKQEYPKLVKTLLNIPLVEFDPDKHWSLQFGKYLYVKTSPDNHEEIRRSLNDFLDALDTPEQRAIKQPAQDELTTVGTVAAVRVDPRSNKQNLIMLSVNKNDGIQPGMKFIVYRDKKYIVKATVQKVFPDMVACIIDQETWNNNGLTVKDSDSAAVQLIEAKQGTNKSQTDPEINF